MSEQKSNTDFMANDLINVTSYGKEKITFNAERGDVTFFCHDCQDIREVDRPNPRKMHFKCKECKSKKIAFGTHEGILEHYERKIKKWKEQK